MGGWRTRSIREVVKFYPRSSTPHTAPVIGFLSRKQGRLLVLQVCGRLSLRDGLDYIGLAMILVRPFNCNSEFIFMFKVLLRQLKLGAVSAVLHSEISYSNSSFPSPATVSISIPCRDEREPDESQVEDSRRSRPPSFLFNDSCSIIAVLNGFI